MFRCKKCEALESEVGFLRLRNKELTDRLLAVANPMAFEAVRYQDSTKSDDYYGGVKGDQYISYDEFGQKILVEKDNQ